jgi:hypothetical protein
MRYPIRRSNSRLSFAFQEPKHLVVTSRVTLSCSYQKLIRFDSIAFNVGCR